MLNRMKDVGENRNVNLIRKRWLLNDNVKINGAMTLLAGEQKGRKRVTTARHPRSDCLRFERFVKAHIHFQKYLSRVGIRYTVQNRRNGYVLLLKQDSQGTNDMIWRPLDGVVRTIPMQLPVNNTPTMGTEPSQPRAKTK
jgi:hypothetical protein